MEGVSFVPEIWQEWEGSNPRPAVLECGAACPDMFLLVQFVAKIRRSSFSVILTDTHSFMLGWYTRWYISASLSVWRVSRVVWCKWSGVNVEVDSMMEVGCW